MTQYALNVYIAVGNYFGSGVFKWLIVDIKLTHHKRTWHKMHKSKIKLHKIFCWLELLATDFLAICLKSSASVSTLCSHKNMHHFSYVGPIILLVHVFCRHSALIDSSLNVFVAGITTLKLLDLSPDLAPLQSGDKTTVSLQLSVNGNVFHWWLCQSTSAWALLWCLC